MSFKALKVIQAIQELYQKNEEKLAEADKWVAEMHPDYSMALQASGNYRNLRIMLDSLGAAGGINWNQPLEEQVLSVERTMALCRHRGWPADWQSRMAYLTEEASEYFSALRGKGSQDVTGEGGDLLNCVYATLGISNIDPVAFENRMVSRINELWDAPRRPGEHFETRPKPTRLTPGWITDSDRPKESSAIWILTPSGEVYPAFYKKEKIAGVWWTSWYWEDGEQIKSHKNVAGWMLREFDRPALELTDEEVKESDTVQDDNEA